MREIKFRGYDLDGMKWYYGGYVKFDKVCLCFSTEKEVEENEEHLILFQGFSDWNLPQPRHMVDVIAESVGQYTGLKDSKNKEVYEGDIIFSDGWKPSYGIVKFIEGGFCIMFDSSDDYPVDINIMYPSGGCQFEVVGNYYENSNLITG